VAFSTSIKTFPLNFFMSAGRVTSIYVVYRILDDLSTADFEVSGQSYNNAVPVRKYSSSTYPEAIRSIGIFHLSAAPQGIDKLVRGIRLLDGNGRLLSENCSH